MRHGDRDAVHLRHDLVAHDLAGGAEALDAALREHGGGTVEHEGVVGEVRRHEHPDAAPAQALDEPHKTVLVAKVEVGGRLVEQERLGFLGERGGDHHQLALSPGDLGVGPLRQMLDAEVGQLLAGERDVGRAGAREIADARGAPHRHDVDYVVGEGGGVRLRQVGEAPRQLGRPIRPHRPPVELHRARKRPQLADQVAQKRRLARAVGAQDAQHPGRLVRERDPVEHRPRGVVAEPQVRRGQAHHQFTSITSSPSCDR